MKNPAAPAPLAPSRLPRALYQDVLGGQPALVGGADLMPLFPRKRIGEPDGFAQVAAWLASDAADYVTRATLSVDAGVTLYLCDQPKDRFEIIHTGNKHRIILDGL